LKKSAAIFDDFCLCVALQPLQARTDIMTYMHVIGKLKGLIFREF